MNQFRLGRIPNKWEAEEIRCGILDFYIDANGHLQFFYRNWDANTLIKSWSHGDLLNVLPLIKSHVPPPRLEGLVETPFDLRVGKPCYIVLRLIERNWHFRQYDAVTTKVKHDDIYGGLTYVLPDSQTYVGERGVSEKCLIVHFAAIDPPTGITGPRPYEHGVNFHVDLDQSNGKSLPLVIDPDIKYPGGNN